MELTQKELKRVLKYNLKTGIFTWKVKNSNRIKIGDICNYLDPITGYIYIGINGCDYLAHRLAFLYVEGKIPVEVDHEDHIRNNNIWTNLTSTTRTENQHNRTLNKNNKSGFNGVHYCNTVKKWRASIKLNGKKKHLGYFINKQDAINIRVKANKEYKFHKNHGC